MGGCEFGGCARSRSSGLRFWEICGSGLGGWGCGSMGLGDAEMVVRRVLGDEGFGGEKNGAGCGFQTRWLESCSPVNRAAVLCSSLGRRMVRKRADGASWGMFGN